MNIQQSHSRLYRRLAGSTALTLALAVIGPIDLGPNGQLEAVSLARAADCCFTADTPILMANGQERRISEIRPGEMVLGGEGRANRVLGIERVPLAGRRLHAINDVEPFFTPEHPFLSRAGWKSIDPVASRLGTKGLAVSELLPGDILVAAQPGRTIVGATALQLSLVQANVQVFGLRGVTAPEQNVFNLILDGDHTYVANGFIVHNKGQREGGGGLGGSDLSGGLDTGIGGLDAGVSVGGSGGSSAAPGVDAGVGGVSGGASAGRGGVSGSADADVGAGGGSASAEAGASAGGGGVSGGANADVGAGGGSAGAEAGASAGGGGSGGADVGAGTGGSGTSEGSSGSGGSSGGGDDGSVGGVAGGSEAGTGGGVVSGRGYAGQNWSGSVAGGVFEGNADPAGPDLTTVEELDMILRGWAR